MRSRLPAPLRAYLDSWFAAGAAPPPGLRVQFVPCAAVTGHSSVHAPDDPTGAWTLLLGDDVAEEVGV